MPPLGPVKESLETLSLRRNLLDSISNAYFNGFQRLHSIDLAHNRLNAGPNTSPLADILRILYLEQNVISSLSTFLTSTIYSRLSRLNVSNNKLNYLNVEMIILWPNLRFLYVSGNLFQTLGNLSDPNHGTVLQVSRNKRFPIKLMKCQEKPTTKLMYASAKPGVLAHIRSISTCVGQANTEEELSQCKFMLCRDRKWNL